MHRSPASPLLSGRPRVSYGSSTSAMRRGRSCGVTGDHIDLPNRISVAPRFGFWTMRSWRRVGDLCAELRQGSPPTNGSEGNVMRRFAPMDPSLAPPTVDLLLDTRTPAELAIAPDGSAVAFALHATVADEGSFQPSDLYVIGIEPGTSAEPVTNGGWADQTPAWSPDGSRLAFLSDRITPGHHLPYTMPSTGEDPTLAATLTGSAESVAWSSDGSRLLVLAADPGSYGLDWSARAVTGAEPEPDPVVRRPGDSRRRLFLVDLASGNVRGGRASRSQRVGGGLGRGGSLRRRGVHRSLRFGLVPRRGGPDRSPVENRRDGVPTAMADGGSGAVARGTSRRGDGGLRERPRAAGRQRDGDRSHDR